MSTYDLIVRGGHVVREWSSDSADLAVVDGRIVAIGTALENSAAEEIDAHGLHVFPGGVDAHVHFNEPGRAEWEGFATGTRALAAGGTTTFFDMPLNSHPPTTDGPSFDLKYEAAQASSLVDFALWGGLVPGNLDRMDELAARGVIGFKAFMASSGIDDFPMADDLTLYEGMAHAAKLGLPVAVHAENDQITRGLAERAIADARTGVRDYLASRPVVAEIEAIQRAIAFAEATRCSLHIVHVSTGRGVELVAQAREGGVNVTCETCPHYLVFDEEEVERLWPASKCAPPIRTAAERDALWQHVERGSVRFIASDHSPAPPEMKNEANAFKVWGGIAGCQHLLPLVLTEGYHKRRLALNRVIALTAEQAAERFGLLGQKGRIMIGADADLALVDLSASYEVRVEDLFYRHKMSPYVGKTLCGQVMRSLVRGRTVFVDGQIVSEPIGRLVRPRTWAERHARADGDAQRDGMALAANGREYAVASIAELREHLEQVWSVQYLNLFLERPGDGPVLSALTNGDRGWLMYLRDNEGDPGFSSRDTSHLGPPDQMLKFRLSNGQVDEYPVSWTLPIAEVVRAFEYFFEYRQRAPWITWHDDSQQDE
jgi:allantoinase